MAPERRRKDRQHWPKNLYATTKNHGLYYYYLRPDLPRQHLLKYNKFGYVREREAIDAAIQLNLVFAAGGNLAENVLRKAKEASDTGCRISDYIDEFMQKTLPSRRINGLPLSEHTLAEYSRLYRNIKKELGVVPIKVVTQANIAELLNKLGTTPEVYNKYRSRLIDLYRHAVSDGHLQTNLPEKILPRDKEKKKRQRITLPGDTPGDVGIDGIEAYQAIWKGAPHEIRCAMELELNTLQRREEIHRWRFDWLKETADGRHIYIRINKTHKHGISSYIRVPESLSTVHSEFGAKTLGDLINHCRGDGLHALHLVHRKPKRMKKAKFREHPFQLTAQQISKGFAAARDKTGIYAHLPPGRHPTFHELIALGQHLREKQGWTVAEIQKLRGHTKESTTRIYLEGHDWVTIEP